MFIYKYEGPYRPNGDPRWPKPASHPANQPANPQPCTLASDLFMFVTYLWLVCYGLTGVVWFLICECMNNRENTN